MDEYPAKIRYVLHLDHSAVQCWKQCPVTLMKSAFSPNPQIVASSRNTGLSGNFSKAIFILQSMTKKPVINIDTRKILNRGWQKVWKARPAPIDRLQRWVGRYTLHSAKIIPDKPQRLQSLCPWPGMFHISVKRIAEFYHVIGNSNSISTNKTRICI